MSQFITQRRSVIWLFLLVFTVSSCGTLISTYDKVAYQNATSLKVESLALMDKATGLYGNNKKDVEAFLKKVDKAYEYAKGLPKNEIVTKQWQIMKDPSRNLLGGFLVRWEEKGKLTKFFVIEAKKLVSDGFDMIIGLESGKIKSEDIK